MSKSSASSSKLKQSSMGQLKQVLPKVESPNLELPQEEAEELGELSPPHPESKRLTPKVMDNRMAFIALLRSCNR
jgi:hypothetical protein